ncbi:MAG: hypothetical protein IKB97_00550 [Bacteroidaceae bacterium]|nr:hypothetical protein [Bacteroidaceae bacterium]
MTLYKDQKRAKKLNALTESPTSFVVRSEAVERGRFIARRPTSYQKTKSIAV